MKKIILDTNFLMIPYQFKVDIFDEINRIVEEKYELITFDSVIKELKGLMKSKGKDAIAAKIGLELIKRKRIKIVKIKEKKTDDAILKLANENTIIATNDRLLIQRLKNRNIRIIYLRGRKHLSLS